MGTKLRNLSYHPLVKGISILLIIAMAVYAGYMAVELYRSGEYAYSDEFEKTQPFRETHRKLAEDVMLEALGRDHYKERRVYSTTFAFHLVDGEDNVILSGSTMGTDLGTYSSSPNGTLWSKFDTSSLNGSIAWYLHSSVLHNGFEELETKRGYPEPVRLYTSISPKDDTGLIGKEYQGYEVFRQWVGQLVQLAMFGGMAILILLYGLIQGAGQRRYDSEVHLGVMDKVDFEIFISVTMILSAIPFILLTNLHEYDNFNQIMAIASGWAAFLAVLFILSISRRAKARTFWRSWFTVRFIGWFIRGLGRLLRPIGNIRMRHVFKPLWVVYTLVYLVALLVLSMSAVYSAVSLVVAMILLVCGLAVLVLHLNSLSKVFGRMENLANGKLDHQVDPVTVLSGYRPILGQMESIQEGIEVSVADALKSEKLKTELIANVTHDLKNPLTSIISYTDLLSKEDLDNERAQEYVGILRDKAGRLNHLINQLVEASKASSGHMDVTLVSMNLLEMLHQVSGEYGTIMEARKLNLVEEFDLDQVSITSDPVVMHRILDNLYSNSSKYAMEGSRVYVQLKDHGDHVLLDMKNMSAEPLNIPIEDLMGRFVRGEASRTSEGNGLGLSIALSLSAVLGVEMTPVIDGDLFKVSLLIPKKKGGTIS